MGKPPLSASQLRLLLIPQGSTPPNKPLKPGGDSAAAWPTLLPLSLPYPSAPDVMVDFFISGNSIYEINKGSRSQGTCSALLPPDLVLADGSLLLATPIDPLLLLLPHLKQHAATAFVPLLDAAAPTKFKVQVRQNLQAVAQHPAVLRRLHFACDIRMLNAAKTQTEDEGEAACKSAAAEEEATPAVSAEEGETRRAAAQQGTLFVRFNMERALAFLVRKHAKLAAAIALQRGISSSSGGVNPSLASSPADCSSNALSFSLLSAYLAAPIAAALEQRLKKIGAIRGAVLKGPEETCMQQQRKAGGSSSGAAAAAAAAKGKRKGPPE
ncbi:hypothetical protein, conserved [Eimeria brunetti]|uniref:Uncharacterized protein n=1 Tax=Eimeria brunetti TaxID=51314 RepID=U6LWR9_9EIME|nr:hypothetical protein, conserved [Eimeria brunetti]